MKNYQDINVYEATQARLQFIFSEFDNAYLSFSGGKDSSIMLNLTVQYMIKNKIERKLPVLFIDLEGQYTLTIEHIKEMFDLYKDYITPYWVCLPLNLSNAVSSYDPFWRCWDSEHKDKWIRKMPKHTAVINEGNHQFDFFKYGMEFEQFVVLFGKWLSPTKKKTACMVGIRTDESLNRFRTIVSTKKQRLKNRGWTTKITNNLYNCYPIYDWRTKDIWIANCRYDFCYNKLYDMFYYAGLTIDKMRICQPYGFDQRIGLELFRIIEPQTWSKLVNRVSGANFGNVYCGTKAIGYRKVELPEGHTWKSYTKLLLNSLPPQISAQYKKKFITFIKYWNKKGSPISNEYLDQLPKEAFVTHELSTRGNKDKYVVRYKKIPDCLKQLEAKRYAPTWRRMAMSIIKNDILCKGLSFAQTKQQVEKQKAIIDKYKNTL